MSEDKETKFLANLSILLPVLIIILYLLRAILPIEPFRVSGVSMYPTYEDKQFVWINKLAPIEKGDVVVIKVDLATYYIKRVIATPGDSILITDNKVFVNGKAINEPYLNEQTIENAGMFGALYTVKPDEYVCLGDNRNDSYDSRDFGPVNINQIKGRVK